MAISEGFFISLAADENIVASEIFRGPPFDAKAAILQLSLQTVNDERYPSRSSFQESDTQVGEGIEDAVHNHAGSGDGQWKWHPEGARGREDGISIKTQVAVTAAMNALQVVECEIGPDSTATVSDGYVRRF